MEKSNRKLGKEDDEDMLFFKSLLPHIKNIPSSKILSVRNRVQDLVQQFAYASPATCPSPSDSSPLTTDTTQKLSPYESSQTRPPSQPLQTTYTE